MSEPTMDLTVTKTSGYVLWSDELANDSAILTDGLARLADQMARPWKYPDNHSGWDRLDPVQWFTNWLAWWAERHGRVVDAWGILRHGGGEHDRDY